MRMTMVAALIVGVFGTAGCGDDTTKGSHDMSAGGGRDAGTDGGHEGDAGQRVLSQGDIAAILDALNDGEVMEAQTAQSRGLGNSDVASFAAEMISVHGAAKTRQDALFAQLGVTATPNDVSVQLMASAAMTVTTLNGLPLAQLEAGYVDSQVTAHQMALAIIDDDLVPNASAPALQMELTSTRATVAMHLQMAEQLQSQLVGLDH